MTKRMMRSSKIVTPSYAVNASFLLVLFLCVALPSVAQIGKYERVKKLNFGTYNFHGDTTIDQKRDRGFYVVYSDRDENSAFNDAYAQKRNPAQPFLKPYFVINEKNDYMELVTFDRALIGKPKGFFAMFYLGNYTFADSKSAEYIGWVHKDKLLHHSYAEMSAINYRPVRYVLGVKKLTTLYNIEKFVEEDKVKLYLDPSFKKASDKQMDLNQIVYVFKENERKTAVLISNKSQISEADAEDRIMGWVSKDLVNYVGQQQVYSTEDVDSIVFFQPSYFSNKEVLQKNEIASSLVFNTEKHEPRRALDTDTVGVMVPASVWDHSLNTLTNVEGDELLISKIDEIKQQNKRINFHFIFDSSDDAKLKQIKLMASLQRIWLLYAENEEYSDYEFTFSTSSYGTNEFYLFKQTTSFPDWIEYINKVLLNDPNVYKSMVNDVGIERCFNYVLASSDTVDFSTNIVVVSGMKAFTRMSARTKTDITRRLARASTRLIFFQLANNPEDVYQEYILQAKDLLSRVAMEYGEFIKSFTVDNNLVKEKNIFNSIPSEDNLYVYDSPKASNYQGGIGFSKMNSELVPTSFDLVLDSVIANTLRTNRLYTESLDAYNSKLGFLRSRPSRYIDKVVEQDSTYQGQANLIPRNRLDESYNRYEELIVAENDLSTAYLLSEPELQILIDNYKSLTPLFSGDVERSERRVVAEMYAENVKNLNELFMRKVLTEKSTVADLVFIKSGIPVGTQRLHEIKLKDILKKRKIGHEEFQQLLLDLRKKVDELETIFANDINMTKEYDASTRYFFIPAEKLY